MRFYKKGEVLKCLVEKQGGPYVVTLQTMKKM